MIFCYLKLKTNPTIFQKVTGLTVSEFDDYMEPLIVTASENHKESLMRESRQRDIGGGRDFDLDWRDQFLATLVWLRLYPTNEVLGYFFDISDSSANRVIHRCLPVLEKAGYAQIKKSQVHASRKRGYDLGHIFEEVPGLAVVVDAFEQEVEKPQKREEADKNYSGKKKKHTIKTQVTVDAYTGEIVDIADSVPGRVHDKALFDESGVIDRLPDDTTYMGDLGYIGWSKKVDRSATPRKKPRGKERPEEDKAYNKLFARSRIIVEHTIAHIRNYHSLTIRDRHHRQYHTGRVVAVSGLVNYAKRCRYVY